MDTFLETYSLPRLNQEEIDNMNRPITSNETEFVIKTTTTTKTLSKQKSRTGQLQKGIQPNI